jgi:preprotein translocase subunit SecB
MQPSPIQLKEMVYLGIKVWPQQLDENETPLEQAEDQTSKPVPFDFNGVVIGERIETKIFGDENDPTLYGVKLRIAIENKEGKIAPYTLEVEVAGFFEIIGNIPIEERENMIIANGSAVLYSGIRDQVMTISARCSQGIFILPTVNFLDRIKKEPDVAQDNK